jgi:hypothetical protein
MFLLTFLAGPRHHPLAVMAFNATTSVNLGSAFSALFLIWRGHDSK